MNIWYSCTEKEFLEAEQDYFKDGALILLEKSYLGDEEEPLDLFVWGDSVTKVPVLRSAVTVNNSLYWRT